MSEQPDQPDQPDQPSPRPVSDKTLAAARRIIEALRAKGVEDPICPLCRNNVWTVGAYTPLFVATNVNRPSLGGPSYPLIALVCATCGNTQLVNLLTLGFKPEELETLAFEDLPGAP